MRPTLTHLALHVPDLDACIAFYTRFCGMRVFHERPGKGSRIVWMAGARQGAGIHLRDHAGRHGSLAGGERLQPFRFRHGQSGGSGCGSRIGAHGWLLDLGAARRAYPVGYYCGVRDPAGNYVEFSYGQPLGPGAEECPRHKTIGPP